MWPPSRRAASTSFPDFAARAAARPPLPPREAGPPDGAAEFEAASICCWSKAKIQAALDAAATAVLSPALLRAVAAAVAAAEEEDSDEDEDMDEDEDEDDEKKGQGQGKTDAGAPPPTPAVAAPLCDSGPFYDADEMGMEETPAAALFLFLRASFRTTNNSPYPLSVAKPFEPAAATAPLAVWALTKLAFHLNVPFVHKAPAWLLGHCTGESMNG